MDPDLASLLLTFALNLVLLFIVLLNFSRIRRYRGDMQKMFINENIKD